MIISDEHRFAFIHIPKCAGVSVKTRLHPIDDLQGRFQHIDQHPQMGMVHYSHIVLRDVQCFYPEEYAKVKAYRSIAVVRDPVDRFVSALFQRLREFKNLNQSEISPVMMEQEADEVIRYLSSTPVRLDLEHVHFNRQVDYIAVNGEKVVSNVFALERMDDISAFIRDCTGVSIEEDRQNRTTEIRVSGLKPVIRMLRAPYAKLVPLPVRERVRARLVKAGVYADVEKRRFVPKGGKIDGFIREYYAEDLALYAASR